MDYDDLFEECTSNDIYVIEKADFKSPADGLINGDVIGLNKKLQTNRQRACIWAEELGHYHTTVGNILRQKTISERKQELRARVWVYNKLIGLNSLLNAYKRGCYSVSDTADYLNVTEDFLFEAIQYYRGKYGLFAAIDNYVIYFEPSLGVLEIV